MNVFALIISFGSFIVSFLTFLYVRGHVAVVSIWKTGYFDMIVLDTGEEKTIQRITDHYTHKLVLYRLNVTNTANHSVGLSDFEVTDDTDKQLNIFTKDNVYGTYGNKDCLIRLMNINGEGFIAHLPQGLTHVIGAKQTSYIDIAMLESVVNSAQGHIFVNFGIYRSKILPWKMRVKVRKQKYDLTTHLEIRKSVLKTLSHKSNNFFKKSIYKRSKYHM
ncbi:hypothetical protein [Leuconostoc suionicum]|uniref:hypothetical protein n=1 Tax=Leuconostoc suionicum TaxID=1511761 RepID=UPI00233F3E11|nr:hypothetical protein [Leuconostoc suionicum]MDC2804814.1 hypothetical protein [Leuconostoc suionicum]MDC2822326.1 hypothetical protein [Leuconostoc suionicum]